MLDGLEIYKSLTHFLPYDDNDKEKLAQKDKTLTPGERKQEEEKYYTGWTLSEPNGCIYM